MNKSKRILIFALVVVLLIAFVPLGGRIALVPCQYMWRYAISYGLPPAHTLIPDNAFPGFPPRCLDVLPNYPGML